MNSAPSRGMCNTASCIFFHDRNVAVLSHNLTKEDSIPPVEIERALKRKRQFEQNPEKHPYAAD